MINGMALSKAGYTKFERCCARAAEEWHSYVWVDTCCINKDSAQNCPKPSIQCIASIGMPLYVMPTCSMWLMTESRTCTSHKADGLHVGGRCKSSLLLELLFFSPLIRKKLLRKLSREQRLLKSPAYTRVSLIEHIHACIVSLRECLGHRSG